MLNKLIKKKKKERERKSQVSANLRNVFQEQKMQERAEALPLEQSGVGSLGHKVRGAAELVSNKMCSPLSRL